MGSQVQENPRQQNIRTARQQIHAIARTRRLVLEQEVIQAITVQISSDDPAHGEVRRHIVSDLEQPIRAHQRSLRHDRCAGEQVAFVWRGDEHIHHEVAIPVQDMDLVILAGVSVGDRNRPRIQRRDGRAIEMSWQHLSAE